MNGNRTFTRVPKKTFAQAEASEILDHISARSVKVSGESLPPFAKGYLVSMLTKLSEVSPAVKRELLADLEHIRSATPRKIEGKQKPIDPRDKLIKTVDIIGDR